MHSRLRHKSHPLAAGYSGGYTVQSDGGEMTEPPHCFLPHLTLKPEITKPNVLRRQARKVNEGSGPSVRNTQHYLIPLVRRYE